MRYNDFLLCLSSFARIFLFILASMLSFSYLSADLFLSCSLRFRYAGQHVQQLRQHTADLCSVPREHELSRHSGQIERETQDFSVWWCYLLFDLPYPISFLGQSQTLLVFHISFVSCCRIWVCNSYRISQNRLLSSLPDACNSWKLWVSIYFCKIFCRSLYSWQHLTPFLFVIPTTEVK